MKGPYWGSIYRDITGSGSLMPCTRSIYSSAGELLAVLGIDFRLRDIRPLLPVPEVRNYKNAWLLNQDGNVVTSTFAANDPATNADKNNFSTLELQPFDVPEVLRERENSSSSGELIVGTSRYLYAEVPAIGWVYVVEAGVR